ncbi:tRNA splicing endonuclease subunit 2 [Xylocopa sonorina]|uniref:tRNA splicing endonuclease subunit 2 n=1 Tax=Xylocopa sonorina TaxID=1818115 RepID=UPI00403A9512
MNLREPKKKRRVKLKEQLPFPIVIDNSNEWSVYTAQLTDLGSYIADPNEIIAVHSMGYFGKGSLSRGFPSFGKARYGAPPVIRNRQWVRRQEWLKQFNKFSMESNSIHVNSEENKSDSSPSKNLDNDNVELLNDSTKESTVDIIEIDMDSVSSNKKHEKKQIDKEIEIECVDSNSSLEDDMLVILDKSIDEECSNTDNQKESVESEDKEISEIYFKQFSFEDDDVQFIDSSTNIEAKLLVLPDSDSETENYFKNIKPKIENESFPVQETLHLTFEETFFLLYGLGCLNVIDFEGNLLDIDSAWHIFCKADKNFIPKYVVYHYFRSKGWVVKPGLKYGGDFLLYKQGPPFYHASYIVLIDILDGDTLVRDQSKSMHKFMWNNLLGLERLSETAAKEILFAQVLWPSSALQTSNLLNVDVLSEFSVRELLWRRWNPKHHNDLDEEDDDSC